MNKAAQEHSFTWEDPPDEVKLKVATQLAQIAQAYGMQLSMCGQRQFLAPGIADASCVDITRLSDVAGKVIVTAKKAHRPDCGCYASKDIGEYDTCPHGCVYCYAVRNRALARRHYKEHDPQSEFLLPPKGYVSTEKPPIESKPVQGKLF